MSVGDGATELKVSMLEGFGGGTGTRLLQAAVCESIARGYQGQLVLEAAPQAVGWYEDRGFVLRDDKKHYLSPEAALRLLGQ